MTELEFKPYTKQRMVVKEIVEISHHPVKIEKDLWELEKYYGAKGESRTVWRIHTPEGQKINDEVLDVFGINLLEDYGTKAVAKMIPQNIVSAGVPEGYFLSPDGLVSAALKLYLDDKTACMKVYRLPDGEELPDLPHDVNVVMVADYEALGKLPFPEELIDCHDAYFLGDHEIVSSFFNKDLPQGRYMTGYGIRYRNGKIVKMKSYVYDDPTPQSQWIGITQMHRMIYKKDQ